MLYFSGTPLPEPEVKDEAGSEVTVKKPKPILVLNRGTEKPALPPKPKTPISELSPNFPKSPRSPEAGGSTIPELPPKRQMSSSSAAASKKPAKVKPEVPAKPGSVVRFQPTETDFGTEV